MGFFKDFNEDAVEEGEELIDEAALMAASEEMNDDVVLEDMALLDGIDGLADEAVAEETIAVDTAVEEAQTESLFEVDTPAADDEEYVISQTADRAVSRPVDMADEQVTVITKGTTINGSIVSDCSLNVMGTINGDIECIGKLTITGNVVGNSTASDVYVNAKRLEGNIDSDGTVKIGLGTVVVGDIKAGSAVVAGAVKGEIDVRGPVIFDSTAIIKGNVKAKSVQMNNGAVLEGFCSLSYASVDIDEIFE